MVNHLDKKGIAIPYIIALILGIIVVGVIGYWFFATTGTGGGSAAVANCNAKKLQWCNEWTKTGFQTSPSGTLGTWDAHASGCTALGVGDPSETSCRSLTGQLLKAGATCTSNSQCESASCRIPTGQTEGTCR